ETAFLELVEADTNGIGALVVTTLTNDFMPLLRYRIGALAQKIETPYGSSYIVHGRGRDALVARDGQRVTTWQVDQCFTGVNGIAHYELRMEPTGHGILRFVSVSLAPTQ